MVRIFVGVAGAALLLATPAGAASDDAWKEFRAKVERACVAAAADLIDKPRALVDPFGSEHYGLALMRGKAKGAKAEIATICVYDKKSEAAEIGSELDLGKAQAKR